jgi:ABC-type antimicrobial peptide transport system permease subunit
VYTHFGRTGDSYQRQQPRFAQLRISVPNTQPALPRHRIIVQLLAGFAGFGVILASLGLYAVISYSVSQRTREIGVRMALGAAPRAMQGQILTQTMTLAAIGLAIGLPAAWMGAKAIQRLLFGVVSSDPVTFGGVAAVVAIVAGLAGYVPATRASRIDPVVALRSE